MRKWEDFIIPSPMGNSFLGVQLVPYMANFSVISSTTVALAIIHDEVICSVAVLGGFLRDSADDWTNMRPGHFISGKDVS